MDARFVFRSLLSHNAENTLHTGRVFSVIRGVQRFTVVTASPQHPDVQAINMQRSRHASGSLSLRKAALRSVLDGLLNIKGSLFSCIVQDFFFCSEFSNMTEMQHSSYMANIKKSS